MFNLLKIIIVMETIKVTVDSLRVFNGQNGRCANVLVNIKEEIDGQETVNGILTKKQVKNFTIPLAALNAQLSAINDDIADWRAGCGGILGQEQLGKLLRNAVLEVTNQELTAGELYVVDGVEKPVTHDFFKVDVVGLELTPHAAKKLAIAAGF